MQVRAHMTLVLILLLLGPPGLAVDGTPAISAAPARDAAPPVAADPCAGGTDLGPVRVQLGSVEAVAEVGKSISLPVRVKGVCDLARFAFWVSYDSRIARLVNVEPTPFLAGEPAVETQFQGLKEGLRAQTIAAARSPDSGGVAGIGTLARLVFQGVSAGATKIDLVRLRLFDASGDDIPSQPFSVRLTVVPGREAGDGKFKSPRRKRR